jgi:hypothetical protein
MAGFSAKTLQFGREGDDILKVLKEKTFNQEIEEGLAEWFKW